jgi:hypothetical protein
MSGRAGTGKESKAGRREWQVEREQCRAQRDQELRFIGLDCSQRAAEIAGEKALMFPAHCSCDPPQERR